MEYLVTFYEDNTEITKVVDHIRMDADELLELYEYMLKIARETMIVDELKYPSKSFEVNKLQPLTDNTKDYLL